jgi:two-component system, OmpR family, alkaline phosphatase synthesis response regulator PhoP
MFCIHTTHSREDQVMNERTDQSPTILIVDDEEHIVQLLEMNLRTQGLRSLAAYTGEECLQLAATEPVDVILLDVMMPGMDGIETCRRLKQDTRTRHIPVIIVSARSEDDDRIRGLEGGADDYVSKPFNMKELYLRIQAALRQVEVLKSLHVSTYEVGPLLLDTRRHLVTFGDQRLDLTLTEFRILQQLMGHAGQVVMREDLSYEIFDKSPDELGRTIDVHIRHIRKKMGQQGISGVEIQTIRGEGYMLESTDR